MNSSFEGKERQREREGEREAGTQRVIDFSPQDVFRPRTLRPDAGLETRSSQLSWRNRKLVGHRVCTVTMVTMGDAFLRDARGYSHAFGDTTGVFPCLMRTLW